MKSSENIFLWEEEIWEFCLEFCLSRRFNAATTEA